MSFVCNCLKLPVMTGYELVKCIRISMNNGESYTVKTNDHVAIQFVKDDKKILIRRGRIKDIVIVNRRSLSTVDDNVSHIILDCSQQFSIKILEIKLKDIIKIGDIDAEFPDYRDRIKELEPNYLKDNQCSSKIPTRHDGMITKEEMKKKLSKPNKTNVCKMDQDSGEFNDLYDMNMNRPYLDELRANEVISVEEDEPDIPPAPPTPSPRSKKLTSRGFPIMR